MLTGVIGTIYIDAGVRTADVTIDGHGVVNKIPIFYHCQDFETATEGNPFIENDEVIIVNFGDAVNLSADNMKIIGFKDGLLRKCGFQFKLTRGDGTLITEDSELLSYIQLYNSDDNLLLITTPIYNTETEYWEFNLADSGDTDLDGYWVDFLCEDGISTQYPYRYKNADKDKDADLIKAGTYEDIIPYWVVEGTGIPGYVGCSGDALIVDLVEGVARNGSYAFLNTATYTKKTNVKTSIPYKITWKTRDRNPRTKRAYETWQISSITYQFGVCWDGEAWVDLAHKCCIFHETPYATCDIGNTSAGPFTLIANTINLTITDSEIPIQEDEAEFGGNIEGTDHIATLSGGTILEIPVCDEGPRASDCTPCENAGNTPFTYTHFYPGVYDCVTIIPSYDY